MAEYYRGDRNNVKMRNTLLMADQSSRTQVVNTQNIENMDFRDSEIYVNTAQGQAKGVYPAGIAIILIWCQNWDRVNMPLNPGAVSILAKREIYVRYTHLELPKDVADLILGWINHVRKIDKGHYAPAILTLANPASTAHQIYALKNTNIDEISAMALAIQYQLMKVVEMTNSPIGAIPLVEFWNKLSLVDELADRMKVFHFRHRSSASDMVVGASKFHATDLYLKNCWDCNNNHDTAAFLQSLRVREAASQAANRSGRSGGLLETPTHQQPMMGFGLNPNPTHNAVRVQKPPGTGTSKICNFCRVSTEEHTGANCPWKGKKSKNELKKMTPNQRKVFPA